MGIPKFLGSRDRVAVESWSAVPGIRDRPHRRWSGAYWVVVVPRPLLGPVVGPSRGAIFFDHGLPKEMQNFLPIVEFIDSNHGPPPFLSSF